MEEMDRRAFMATAGAAAFSFAYGLPYVALAQADPEAALAAMLDKFFNDEVDDSPERATSLGLDKGARAGLKARLTPRTAAEKAKRLGESKQRLAALKTIDRARLNAASQVNYDTVAYQLTTSIEGSTRFTFGDAGGRYSPYVISQLTGSYQQVPDFLDGQHKISDAADADAYLSRLHAFSTVMDEDLVRVRTDAAAGVVPPDFVIDLSLGQMKALREQPAAQMVLVSSLAKKLKAANISGDYEAKATAIVEKEVFPALDRQIAAMQALRAKATSDAGVWKLPDGEAYYAAALGAGTTTTLSPAEVHQMGLDQVADITGRIDAILKAQGLTKGTVAERLTTLGDDPKYLYPNTDEGRTALIAQLNAQIDAMYPRLPQMFRTLPGAKVVVKRVPVFIQDGAANGYYQRAALDGSRPATYFINLKDTHDWPKFGLPSLTYHEAVPGHHLQISIQQESKSIPMIRRTSGFSAYSEGWALYAEQLASEMGVYEGDPFGQAGYLQSFLFRAARLATDTGIHFKRWSRDQATDYMVKATGFPRARTQREVERYCVWPGQACSYKVGHTMWTKMRDQAKAQLGPKFDIKDFHDAGLVNGAVPLTVLETVINGYIAAKQAA
jgi:uncharacterized protein (DUF885 family)